MLLIIGINKIIRKIFIFLIFFNYIVVSERLKAKFSGNESSFHPDIDVISPKNLLIFYTSLIEVNRFFWNYSIGFYHFCFEIVFQCFMIINQPPNTNVDALLIILLHSCLTKYLKWCPLSMRPVHTLRLRGLSVSIIRFYRENTGSAGETPAFPVRFSSLGAARTLWL